jgi:hypothetical protein
MTVKVESVISGEWKQEILIARRGYRSANASFEDYIPGKRYLLAFIREEDEGGLVFFSQSICGTYSKLVE